MKTHMNRHRRQLASVAVASVTLALTGCSGGDSDTLKVYSGRHYGIETAFEKFTEDTGIEVEFLTGNDGELRDPNGYWFGLTVRARTIIYNSDLLTAAEAPATYEELAESEWKGRVCMRNSLNGYQQSLVASLIAADGEDGAGDVVQGWKDNAEVLANDVVIIESVADGLCEVGVANHYYLGRALEENPDLPVDLVWANQEDRGVHVNISGGGVTRYSTHPEMARTFLEWLATDGQSILVDANHEYPANPTVQPEPLITEEFGTDFVRDDLDADDLGRLNPDAIRLMDDVGYG